MYFPTSAARQLSSVPALPLPSELVQSIVPSPRKTLFAAITKSGLSLWRVRVCPTSRTLSPLSEAECVLWSWMDAALRGSRAPLAHADVSAGTWREPAHSVVSGRAETCHPGAHDRRHTYSLHVLSRDSLRADDGVIPRPGIPPTQRRGVPVPVPASRAECSTTLPAWRG